LIKGEEFDAFQKDIGTNGLLHPIALFQGKILDGRNRYNACKALLKEPKFVELPLSINPIAYVLSANEKRRHLSQSQRALVAAKLASLKLGDNQHSGGKGVSIETASKLLNVGKASVNRCKKVLKLGVPELVQMVEQGQVVASVAEEVAILTKEEQTELVKKGARAIRIAVQEDPPTMSDSVDAIVARLLKALEKLEEQNAKAAAAEIVQKLTTGRYQERRKVA
jgi:hypothetical protein